MAAMTKKELPQLYYLNREIDADKRELARLCTAAAGGNQDGDLISRSALLADLHSQDFLTALVRRAIKRAPAVDAEPVRHGQWNPSETDFDDDDILFDVEDWCDWQCSVCLEDICYDDPMGRQCLPKFCPNCGARMDEEEARHGETYN